MRQCPPNGTVRASFCNVPRGAFASFAFFVRFVCFVALAITLSAACAVETVDISKLTGDALNPEAHKADIAGIDAILFEDGGLGSQERAELLYRLLALHKVATSDPANTIAIAIGKDLKRFAAGAERTPVGTSLLNSPLRRQWMSIRSSLFADAAWWRWSSADPIER